MNIEAMQRFRRDGFVIAAGALGAQRIGQIQQAISTSILAAARRNSAQLHERLLRMSAQEVAHAGMLAANDCSAEIMRQAVDTLMVHPMILSVLYSEEMQQLAARMLETEPSTLTFVEPHVRVDLPNAYREAEQKYSLPFHQDGSYYSKGLAQSSALVLSIYPFECRREHGALEISAGSHSAGLRAHETYYLDPNNSRHLRKRLPASEVAAESIRYAETQPGDVAVFDFHLVHRSGINHSDRVRYTLLVRSSRADLADFKV